MRATKCCTGTSRGGACTRRSYAMAVNNDMYRTLGARWYEAQDDPVALLRAEARLRNDWVAREIAHAFGARACSVLDLGCGGGFLSNHLAAIGHDVTAGDPAGQSPNIAPLPDRPRPARPARPHGRALPLRARRFAVVFAMGFLVD